MIILCIHTASEEGENKLFTVRQAESEFEPHRTFGGNLDFKKGSVVGGTHWHWTCIIINDRVTYEYGRSDSAGHCTAIRLLCGPSAGGHDQARRWPGLL